MADPFDFDRIEAWGPQLALPQDAGPTIAEANPESIQDARDVLFELVPRNVLAQKVIEWIKERPVFGYHGTRVTAEELNSIRNNGLLPLVPALRATRLRRSLSAHSNWSEAQPRLDDTIASFSSGHFGRREGQAHLTVSRAGLLYGFNHYLKQGAEFDWHVANLLLGEEGQALITSDGNPIVIKVRVPGDRALEACNPWGEHPTDLPNLVRPLLDAWAYWLAKPTFRSESLELDCGMIFREPVPPDWIEEFISIEPNDLQRPSEAAPQKPIE